MQNRPESPPDATLFEFRPSRAEHAPPRRARRARGMTLIEIMVVLVILGLIAGAIGYNVFAQLKEAQIKNTKVELQSLSNAVDLYHVETGNWPDSLQQLVPKFVRDL